MVVVLRLMTVDVDVCVRGSWVDRRTRGTRSQETASGELIENQLRALLSLQVCRVEARRGRTEIMLGPEDHAALGVGTVGKQGPGDAADTGITEPAGEHWIGNRERRCRNGPGRTRKRCGWLYGWTDGFVGE